MTFASHSSHAADPIKTLPIASALEMAEAAAASCKASGYNVTVMIMDQDYAPRLVFRTDAASPRSAW